MTGKVYRLVNDTWVLGDDKVTIPEGWYCVPPRFVHPEDIPGAGDPHAGGPGR
jgi:hypothetical protein